MESNINYRAIRYYVRIGVGTAMLGIVSPDIFGFSKSFGNALFIGGFVILAIGIFKAIMSKSS